MRICPQCRMETTERSCPRDGFQTVDKARYDPDRQDPLVGTVFDERYRVDAVLGRGGMGAVYRAVQLAVNRPVALKVLRPELAQELKEVARFQQEARAVAALNHPNTIRLFDFGQVDDGSLFLVMEYLEGEPLGALLKREAPLEPARVVRLAEQILESLAEAHAHGIVHRDMKPANLFLTEVFGKRDFVKVLDFGIAKVEGDRAAEGRLTGTGVAIGSPRYIAPEQACGREVTGQADLYALGAILYELLTGGPVFRRRTATDYMLAHIKEQAPPPTLDGEPLRGPLPDLIMRCLDKLPSRRPDGAEGALEAVRRAAAEPVVIGAAPVTVAPGHETKRLDGPGAEVPASGGTGEGTDPSSTSTGRAPLGRPEESAATPAPSSGEGASGGRLPAWALAAVAWLLIVAVAGGGALWWWTGQRDAEAADEVATRAEPSAASPSEAPPGESVETSQAGREEAAEVAALPEAKPASAGESDEEEQREEPEPPADGPSEEEPAAPEEGAVAGEGPVTPSEAAPPEEEEEAKAPEVVEHAVRIESSPRGARVYAGGDLLGRTPLVHRWTGDAGDAVLVLRRGGYRRTTVDVADLEGREDYTVRLERRPAPKAKPSPKPAPKPAPEEEPESERSGGYGRLE
ncbi:MAG: protein kinase domain-containing protein [Myxococcota bacterium]